ncbi:MAG: DUF1326 domain-containing protein [Acidobacteria bacterium]|nr:DUF1326 domain-containing protein [Acidobacteriota bacterium]
MKSIASVSLALISAAGLASAAAANNVRGEYIEARTADVFTGACFANSEVGNTGDVAVLGWRIGQGTFNGVKLDGLNLVAVVRGQGTLGFVDGTTYPVKSVLIVDERANVEQRQALQAFAQRMGGDLLSNVVRVDSAPISFSLENESVHEATATLQAGKLATIRTRAIGKKDHVCSNEEVWYLPLTKVKHAMPAVAMEHRFGGEGLDMKWSSPDKRSAFVADFQLND